MNDNVLSAETYLKSIESSEKYIQSEELNNEKNPLEYKEPEDQLDDLQYEMKKIIVCKRYKLYKRERQVSK